MPYSNAQAIYTALDQITNGNSKSVQAADDLVVVANRTMYYQNHPKGINMAGLPFYGQNCALITFRNWIILFLVAFSFAFPARFNYIQSNGSA